MQKLPESRRSCESEIWGAGAAGQGDHPALRGSKPHLWNWESGGTLLWTFLLGVLYHEPSVHTHEGCPTFPRILRTHFQEPGLDGHLEEQVES